MVAECIKEKRRRGAWRKGEPLGNYDNRGEDVLKGWRNPFTGEKQRNGER